MLVCTGLVYFLPGCALLVVVIAGLADGCTEIA